MSNNQNDKNKPYGLLTGTTLESLYKSLHKNCVHASSCPEKEFCSLSSYNKSKHCVMHPPLFIYIQKDDKYRSMTWIGCEIKRPMAEPKSSYEPIGW